MSSFFFVLYLKKETAVIWWFRQCLTNNCGIRKGTGIVRADAKGSYIPSRSTVVVNAEKVKPNVFLLVGIWHIKLCTKSPW